MRKKLQPIKLTDDQIKNEFGQYMNIILKLKEHEPEKATKLYELINDNVNQLIVCPATSRHVYYGCYEGGLLKYINRVVEYSKALFESWEDLVVNPIDINELIFVALVFELGKIGNGNKEYYLQNGEAWSFEKGNFYTLNEKLNDISPIQLSLFLLQKYNVKLNDNEFASLHCLDSLSNANHYSLSYLYGYEVAIKTEIPFLISSAKHLATRKIHDEDIQFYR